MLINNDVLMMKKIVLLSVSTKNITLIHSCNKHLVSSRHCSSARKILEVVELKILVRENKNKINK